jgi:cell wall-associated NlpC family hydrolase
VSVPVKAAAATAGLSLALVAASATAFADPQGQADQSPRPTAQQAGAMLPTAQDPQSLPDLQDLPNMRNLPGLSGLQDFTDLRDVSDLEDLNTLQIRQGQHHMQVPRIPEDVVSPHRPEAPPAVQSAQSPPDSHIAHAALNSATAQNPASLQNPASAQNPADLLALLNPQDLHTVRSPRSPHHPHSHHSSHALANLLDLHGVHSLHDLRSLHGLHGFRGLRGSHALRALQAMPGLRSGQRRALRLALVQEGVRHRRAELIAGWKARASRAVRFAYSQRGRPYVFGGTGRSGFDCSGLVQQSWRHAGVRLARVARSQFHTIRTHVPVRRLRPGDLLFFNGLGHVGMYVGHQRFIHSPHTGDHVRVARFDNYYRREFVGATRPAWHPLPRIPTSL